MKSTRKNRNERGIALIIALFALLLLSAIGLAMMYSSTTETSVNANFRDKQTAAYASMSGALEARDRLQPLNGDIAAPTGTPSTSLANVIYIVNPLAGESVQPWNYNNKYADTELCQENILGLSGTTGVPCSGSSSLPSGSAWYTSIDDSSSGSYAAAFAAYKQSTPLAYKWTRITLKTDNMTPVSASGGSGTGNQVCWDGKNQVVQAAGASSSCLPTGSVTAINLTSAGTGYSGTPHVSIAAPPAGGTQATAVPIMTTPNSDQVVTGAISSGGSGYTSIPTVTLANGGGIGATAVAVISPLGAPITSVTGLTTPTASSACYQSAPSASFAGGGGTQAASPSVTLGSATCVYSASVSKQGNNCPASSTHAISVGSGSGFAGSITFDASGNVSSLTITSPGTGFSSAPSSISGTGCKKDPSINFTLGSNVTGASVTSGGAGYTSQPNLVVAAPPSNTNAGTPPTGKGVLGAQPSNAGQVIGLTITSGGSGYTSAPDVVFGTDGGGTGAVGSTALGNKQVISGIQITNAGSGYTTAPAVSISGGGGSGATATSTISSGTYYGQVFLITSFAETPSGSKAITQIEAASAVRSFSVTGALTMDGSSPTFGSPSSSPFVVTGSDLNSCGETAKAPKPAIGVYDGAAVTSVQGALQVPANYTGSLPYADVEDVYNSLGDSMSTPTGMEALATAISGMTGANTYGSFGSTTTSINMGTSSVPVVDVVNGDLTLSGKTQGYGILLVRGTLTTNGNFSWNGPIFVIGQGVWISNGGGNGQVTGTAWVAKTRDASNVQLGALGSPSVSWSGGGGNGIVYDHCWADNMIQKINFIPPAPPTPLKILSTRTVTY